MARSIHTVQAEAPARTTKIAQMAKALVVAAAAAMIACACALSSSGSANAAPLTTSSTSNNGLVSGHVYVIRSAIDSNYVLDISGASTSNGANAQLWSLNRTNAQQWKYTVDGSGNATLACVASGKVLDVAGAGTASGTNVWQYGSNGTKAQKWRITKNSSGTYTIASALKSNYVLDVAGARKANGTNIWAYAANGSKAQQWTFYDVTAMRDRLNSKAKSSAKSLAGKTYRISSALKGSMVLDVSGASKSNCANVQLYTSNMTTAQKWRITFDSAGYATITNGSGKVLDVAGAGTANGTNVWQYGSNGSLAQKWIISKNSDGTYTFESALWEGLVLDAAGAGTYNGTNVWVYSSNGTKAQKWTFSAAEYATAVKNSLSGISMDGVRAVGIDVSQWQGSINWSQVAASGIDFAIIRCGYGSDSSSQDDPYFLANVRGARAAGLDIGVYLYSYATNTSMAESEAAHTLRLLRAAGLSPSDLRYGVSFDIEDNSQANLYLPGLCQAYCNKIKAAGYSVSVYSFLNWWNTKLNSSVMNNWGKFIAQWPSQRTGSTKCSYTGSYQLWQFTSSGSVPGISGRVDMDLAY